MKVNLVEFNREKYNFNYKSHIYKIKTIHKLLYSYLSNMR